MTFDQENKEFTLQFVMHHMNKKSIRVKKSEKVLEVLIFVYSITQRENILNI